MANFINLANQILVQRLVGTVTGPCVESQIFDRDLMTSMHVFEFECMNGAVIEKPLPFGLFIDVVKNNFNKAKIVMRAAPGYFDGTPVFNEVCSKQQDIDKLICSATVCRKIVPIGSAIETTGGGINVWSSTIEPIDEVHGLRVTIKDPVLTAQQSSEWDENLQQYVEVTRQLSTTRATAALEAITGGFKHTYYRAVKCGWYEKIIEQFSLPAERSFYKIVNYSWPAVLDSILFRNWQSYRLDVDLTTHITSDHIFPQLEWSKDSYNGPCKALIVEGWTASAPAAPTVTGLTTSSIEYTCPLFQVNTGPCLHGAVSLVCDFGTTDGTWEQSTGSTKTFAATSNTSWPDTVIAAQDVTPSRGGYFVRTTTVYKPS